ncbi:MAG: DNA/RNA non-specific endonuclease [Alphaproteobacteria bacterium]
MCGGLVFAAALLAAPSLSWAASCQDQYLKGAAPRPAFSLSLSTTRELCYDDFAVLHSGAARTPFYSAEHLTAANVRAARQTERVDVFHEESFLPPTQRAALKDYTRSGYDRGHMAPSGDMPNSTAQAQSFTLANMAPQAPALNRGLWEEIEETARGMAERDGDVYIVTGPLYANDVTKLNGRVAVPSGFFKAIYSERSHQVGAYVAANVANASVETISLAQLRDRSGFDVFPTLPANVKTQPADLPNPHRTRVASVGEGLRE